jgi:hypothetical protein
VLRAEADLRISEGSRSALDLSGIDAAGRVRLAAGGAITALGGTERAWLIRSGGDISLLADGTAGSDTLGGRIAMADGSACTFWPCSKETLSMEKSGRIWISC